MNRYKKVVPYSEQLKMEARAKRLRNQVWGHDVTRDESLRDAAKRVRKAVEDLRPIPGSEDRLFRFGMRALIRSRCCYY